jgi:Ankyrin repeat
MATTSMPPQQRKRTARQGGTSTTDGESKRSKFDDVMMELEEQNDSSFTLLDLHRLVHVMENDPSPSFVSWRDIHRRADLCQHMFASVVGMDEGVTAVMLAGDVKRLKERVDAACLRAVEIVIELKAREEGRPDPIQEIFFPKPPQSALGPASAQAPVNPAPSSSVKKDKGTKLDTKLERKGALPKPPPKTNVVADLQEQQREQMEAAVSTMAAQLKHHTSQIHSQLRGQTEHLLSDMETVAEHNVEAVTDVAAATLQHVQRGWRRSVTTWTVLITIGVAFVATLLTIVMIPQRKLSSSRSCLFFCPPKPRPDRFCRTLPNGKEECVDAPISDAKTDPEEVTYINVNVENDVSGDGEEQSESEDGDIYDEYSEVGDSVEDPEEDEPDVDDDDGSVDEPEQDPRDDAQDIALYNNAALAAAADDVERVVAFLAEYPALLSARDQNGWGLLHESVQAGAVNVVQLLLEYGCDPAMRIGDTPTTALDLARRHGADNPIMVLLETAMQTEEPPSTHAEQQCEVGMDGECIQTVESDRLREDEQPVVPQQDATSSPMRDEATDASMNPTFDGRPFTHRELLRAVLRADVRRLRGYMEANPAFLNEADENGWTVLHLAARSGNVAVTETLLSGGSNVHLVTLGGQTALDIATANHGGDSPIAHLIGNFMA